MRFVLFGLVAFVFLLAGCGGNTGPTTCASDASCQSWETCNLSSNTCTLAPGYCLSDLECSDNLTTCDVAQSHLCVYKEGFCRQTSDCQNWQVCDLEQRCRPAPGYCDADSQCNQPTEICSPSKHQCAPAPGYCVDSRDCDAWRQCDAASGRCLVIEGMCGVDSDCTTWQTCDVKTHFCKPKTGFCIDSEDCPKGGWAYCDRTTNKCAAGQGYCLYQNDCNAWELCASKTHRCTPDVDRCNVNNDCGDWQICGSNHYCIAKTGFCNTAADCVQGEQCYQQTHTCQ